jgi:hypothetical protein
MKRPMKRAAATAVPAASVAVKSPEKMLAAAAYVALLSLVRLMLERRNALARPSQTTRGARQPADSSKSIDCYFDCHKCCPSFSGTIRPTDTVQFRAVHVSRDR